jgi:hypothetical protein
MEPPPLPRIHPMPAMESALFIQIHADNQVDSDNERDSRLEEQIRQRLARFEGRITDVEVHVSDVNGPRGGNSDLRCSIEARVNGIPPVAAIDEGDTVDRAVIGAAKKVVRALDHQLGKLADHRRH